MAASVFFDHSDIMTKCSGPKVVVISGVYCNTIKVLLKVSLNNQLHIVKITVVKTITNYHS